MTPETRDDPSARPCLIVGHGDEVHTAQISRAFRRLGWDVYPARTGPEARRLANMLQPDMVVLATDLDGESGWLTCEKITSEVPDARVFLVGDTTEPRNVEFAAFVGAVALVPQTSPQALVEEICGRSLPAAG